MAEAAQKQPSPTASRPVRCIVKLGGAAITNKGELESINEESLRSACAQLRQAMFDAGSPDKVVGMDWSRRRGELADPAVDAKGLAEMAGLGLDTNFVVVHGAGSFGHFQASRSGVHKGGLHSTLVKAGFVATRISKEYHLLECHHLLVDGLLNKEILCQPMLLKSFSRSMLALSLEGESSPPVTFHDFMGQNFSSEHLAASAPGATHPIPYIAYFQPVPPLASSSSSHVTERTMDGSTYHDHWNSLSGPSDGRPLQTVHPIDFHHNHWAHMPRSYAQPNSNNGVAEQPGVPVGAMRVGGLDGDSQQRGSLPSVYGNGSGSRSRIPSVPPLVPHFMRAHGNINEQYQPSSSSLYAGSQLSGGMRPLGAAGPAAPPLLDTTTFSLFPPGPPGLSSMETEDAGRRKPVLCLGEGSFRSLSSDSCRF